LCATLEALGVLVLQTAGASPAGERRAVLGFLDSHVAAGSRALRFERDHRLGEFAGLLAPAFVSAAAFAAGWTVRRGGMTFVRGRTWHGASSGIGRSRRPPEGAPNG